jgi:hypothetical protein
VGALRVTFACNFQCHNDVRLNHYQQLRRPLIRKPEEILTSIIHLLHDCHLHYLHHNYLTFYNSTYQSINMPRNGDGSSDNGPVDAGEIVHGASGDVRSFPTSHPFPRASHLDSSPFTSHLYLFSRRPRFFQGYTDSRGAQTSLKHTQNVAPLPEGEKGEAIEGMNASGGGSAGTSQGAHANDSNKPPVVDQVTKS